MANDTKSNYVTAKCNCNDEHVCCCKHKGGSGCSNDDCKCRQNEHLEADDNNS